MPAERKLWALRVLLFIGLVAVGAWPWDGVRSAYTRGLSRIGNPILAGFPVAGRVQVQLSPITKLGPRRPDQSVQEDTQIVLQVPGSPGEAHIGISLRRDAYLPLLIFVAAIFAVPLRASSRAVCLAVGSALVTLVALGSVWVLIVYLASQHPGAVPGWQGELAHVVFDCWLTPPGNRVIAPLLLAGALVFALRGKRGLAAPPQSPI